MVDHVLRVWKTSPYPERQKFSHGCIALFAQYLPEMKEKLDLPVDEYGNSIVPINPPPHEASYHFGQTIPQP